MFLHRDAKASATESSAEVLALAVKFLSVCSPTQIRAAPQKCEATFLQHACPAISLQHLSDTSSACSCEPHREGEGAGYQPELAKGCNSGPAGGCAKAGPLTAVHNTHPCTAIPTVSAHIYTTGCMGVNGRIRG